MDDILNVEDACGLEAEAMDGVADEDGCPEQTEVTCNEVELDGIVNFDTDSDVIQRTSRALLDDVSSVLTSTPEIRCPEIGAHTDDHGSSRNNLSARSAVSIRWSATSSTQRSTPSGLRLSDKAEPARSHRTARKRRPQTLASRSRSWSANWSAKSRPDR